MKLIKHTFIMAFVILIAISSFPSCEPGDFGDININKKVPSEPVTSYMLTHALRHIPVALVLNGGGDVQTSYFVQYLSRVEYSELYNFSVQSFPFYQSVLINLQEIIDINSDVDRKADVVAFGDNENQLATARILRAYFFLSMTDRWGYIPYFNALQGVDELRPEFDSQEAIYNDLFIELDEAVEQINTDYLTELKGDFLFDSDMVKWQKFANTTRMIMAMRISDVDPERGKEEFTAALEAPGGVLEGNYDNLYYPFLADEEELNYNYFYNWYDGPTPAYAPCNTIIDHMKQYNDPRLQVYAEPAALTGEFTGKELDAGQTDKNSISLLGESFRQIESPFAIYTYSQVLFTLSEAAHRGWIDGGEAKAEEYYNEAIGASFEQHNLPFSSLATYLSNTDIAYSSSAALEKIGVQKWLSLFPNGNEAWNEWRRLDSPELTPVANALTEDGNIPVRYTYDNNVVNLMPDEWAAVNAIQPDKSFTRVWWDVK